MKKFIKDIQKIIGFTLLATVLVSCSDNVTVTEDVGNVDEQIEENKPLASGENTDINLFVATDIHYLSNKINDHGEAFEKMNDSGDGRQAQYISEIVQAFKNDVIKEKPEVLIISGDLTHNGEEQSHLDMAETFKEIEEKGTEVLVIPGNNDINNPYAREFKGNEQLLTEKVTPKEFESIYGDFGYLEAKSRDESTLSYLATPSENLWVLMLDTNNYNHNTDAPVTNGDISKDTLEWIAGCAKLAEENNAKILTVMHHNLYKHSDLLYKGFTLDNYEEVFEVLAENNLKLVLSGHIHTQDIKSDEQNKVYDIVTSSMIGYPHQYGVIKYDNIGYSYTTSIVDVESWATDNGSTNEELLNFNKYSKEYFYTKSYNMAYNELIVRGDFSKEEVQAMADVVATLNVNYFGGTTNEVRDEVIASEGYRLWNEINDTFMKKYVLDMAEEKELNFNDVRIDY